MCLAFTIFDASFSKYSGNRRANYVATLGETLGESPGEILREKAAEELLAMGTPGKTWF